MKITVITEHNTTYSHCLLPTITLPTSSSVYCAKSNKLPPKSLCLFVSLFRLCLSVTVTKHIISLEEQEKKKLKKLLISQRQNEN